MSHPTHKHRHHKKEHRFISHEKALERQELELLSLHPAYSRLVRSVIDHLNNKGWQAFLFQGKTRTPQQAGANVKKKTGIKLSWHRPDVIGVYGNQVVQVYAADIVDERWGWEGPTKNLHHQFWKDLSNFAKAEGLEWGGDFKQRPDPAHVQMRLVDSHSSSSMAA